MNYRHAYHTGNFADVFKHIVLVALTQHFLRKESPFCYLDTHAGVGSYDLLSGPAQKSKEYVGGIKKIIAHSNPPPLIQAYLQCVRSQNKDDDVRYYPGSPLIVKQLLRPTDRMVLTELHPEDFSLLKNAFWGDAEVAVHNQDAYAGLKAFLPPKEKRGFVLIDPPYEKPDEWEQLGKALVASVKRWETGVYAIWYPKKNRLAEERFLRSLQEKLQQPMLIAELSIYREDVTVNLNGCGMVIINPPWQLDKTLEKVLPWVWRALSIEGQGRYSLNTLK